MVTVVLNGPVATEVEAAMEQRYVVKGRREETLSDVCVLNTVL